MGVLVCVWGEFLVMLEECSSGVFSEEVLLRTSGFGLASRRSSSRIGCSLLWSDDGDGVVMWICIFLGDLGQKGI